MSTSSPHALISFLTLHYPQPLVFLDKLTTLRIQCFSLQRVWAKSFGTTGCNSMRPTSRAVQLPRQTSSMIPTDLGISERMCRWTFFTGHGMTIMEYPTRLAWTLSA
eukprot:g81302.t1